MEKKTIGEFIAALRKANGFTQKQLADLLGVSDKAVSRWERDETLPDLTLIPVLAEIFGVTADELLRGQRANTASDTTEPDKKKTGKLLRRFLAAEKTRFKVQSLLSAALGTLGLLVGLLCNFVFYRANLGFFLGSVFCIAGIVCQIIFYILCANRIDAEELEQDSIDLLRRFMHRANQLSLSLNGIVFSLLLPMLLCVSDSYVGIPMYSYFPLGLAYALVCCGICAVVCYIVNARLGFIPKQVALRFRVRAMTALALLAILLITFVLHQFGRINLYANRYILGAHDTYTSFADFKAVMEQPLDPNGKPLTLEDENESFKSYKSSDGTSYLAIAHTFGAEPDDELLFWHCNHTISCFFVTSEGYCTLNTEQEAHVTAVYQTIVYGAILFYPAEILVAILLCRRKIKRMAPAAN